MEVYVGRMRWLQRSRFSDETRFSSFHGRRRYSVLITSVSKTAGGGPACHRLEKMDIVHVRMRIHEHIVELCRVTY
jgi:hypothetical protein